MFEYRSILLFSIVSPPAPPTSPFSSILPRQERWIICFKPTVTAFKKQYPFSLIHELYWTLITGHEPTERSLFFVPETSHTPCVDSTNENGYYRVFLGGMGGGGEEGGTHWNSWWGCATRFSNILIPDSRPKHASFHTRFQTCFFKVVLSFLNQLPYLTRRFD